MNEFYGGRSRVPAAGKVYWQQWVPVARGKGTCGPGIQRALGAAHSIPYPFSSLPRPSNPNLSRTRSPYRLTALRLRLWEQLSLLRWRVQLHRTVWHVDFVSTKAGWPNVNFIYRKCQRYRAFPHLRPFSHSPFRFLFSNSFNNSLESARQDGS